MTKSLIVSEGAARRLEISLAARTKALPTQVRCELGERLCASEMGEVSAPVGRFQRAARSEGALENGPTEEFAGSEDVLDAMPPVLRYKLEVARAAKKIEGLTARETMVLKMLRQGCSSKMIAAEFAMDAPSVERHRASLMRKLNSGHVADAVRIAIYAGLGD